MTPVERDLCCELSIGSRDRGKQDEEEKIVDKEEEEEKGENMCTPVVADLEEASETPGMAPGGNQAGITEVDEACS